MPRETKAQRLEREAAERAAREAEQAAQYLPKLMAALEEATKKNNYELTVVDGVFKLRDRDGESWVEAHFLHPVYTQEDWDQLESLVWDLKMKAEARAEAERKYLVKQAALAKLSKEERELLGL